jgi:hypothetical protein
MDQESYVLRNRARPLVVRDAGEFAHLLPHLTENVERRALAATFLVRPSVWETKSCSC